MHPSVQVVPKHIFFRNTSLIISNFSSVNWGVGSKSIMLLFIRVFSLCVWCCYTCCVRACVVLLSNVLFSESAELVSVWSFSSCSLLHDELAKQSKGITGVSFNSEKDERNCNMMSTMNDSDTIIVHTHRLLVKFINGQPQLTHQIPNNVIFTKIHDISRQVLTTNS